MVQSVLWLRRLTWHTRRAAQHSATSWRIRSMMDLEVPITLLAATSRLEARVHEELLQHL